jgi:tetratricopeptide (TPR) repeat protein
VPASLWALVQAGILAEEDLDEAMVQMSPEELEAQRAEAVPVWLRDLVGEDQIWTPAEMPQQAVEAAVPEELPTRPEEPGEPALEVLAAAEAAAAMPGSEPAEGGEALPAEEVPDWLKALAGPEAEVPSAEAVEVRAPEPLAAVEMPVPEEVAVPLAAVAEPEVPAPVPAALAPAEAEAVTAESQRLQALREELQASPRKHAVRLEVARLSAQHGDWQAALGHYEKLIATRQFLPEVLEDLLGLADQGVNPARVYQLLGDTYVQQDQLDQALEMYRQSRKALLKR